MKSTKKVLIITYYWPPAGGVSVFRPLTMVKYLKQKGWTPIVYVPENASYPMYDDENTKQIPEDIEILKHKIWEPFGVFKKLSNRKSKDTTNPVYVRDRKRSFVDELSIWIRGNFFIPDARMFWINPSVRYLADYLKNNSVDAIISTGPPHSSTMIGYEISQRMKIPFFAEFQDPWTQVDYYKMLKISRFADKRHRYLEQKVFQGANKISIVSPSWVKDLESIGAKNVECIYIGYDEDDFREEVKIDNNKFRIVHAGLLGYDRSPDLFLEALSELKNELPKFDEHLVIDLAGSVDYAVKEKIQTLGLDRNYNDLGFLSRKEAIKMCRQSQLQLLLLNKAANAKGRIPAKFFENIRSYRPILCLGDQNSDVAKIIDKLDCGRVSEYNDKASIKQIVSYYYYLFLKGDNDISKEKQKEIEYYSVSTQIEKLANHLDHMISI